MNYELCSATSTEEGTQFVVRLFAKSRFKQINTLKMRLVCPAKPDASVVGLPPPKAGTHHWNWTVTQRKNLHFYKTASYCGQYGTSTCVKPGNSVRIATGYGLKTGVRIRPRERDFFLVNVTRVESKWIGKADNHSTPCNAEVKNEYSYNNVKPPPPTLPHVTG
jgi:hypothetical protein